MGYQLAILQVRNIKALNLLKNNKKIIMTVKGIL